MEYPIISKKLCRGNRIVRTIQKETKKLYKIGRRNVLVSKKGIDAKAKINKVVRLKEQDQFIDLTTSNCSKELVKKEESLVRKEETLVRKEETLVRKERNLLSKLDELQIRGLSGSGYKTADKIRTLMKSGAKDKTLIINAVECEPGLLHDEWLLSNELPKILEGINLILQSIHFNKVYIASKQIADKVNVEMDSIISCKAKIITVPNYYPIGEEHNLIQYITGLSLKKADIPANKGILVVNVQTIYAIAKSIMEDSIQQSRFLTVANLVEGKAVVVKANMGIKVTDIARSVFDTTQGLTLYSGGGVMNAHIADGDELVDEHTNFIGYQQEIHYNNTTKCKGCGACEKNCPANIPIKHIIKALERNNQSEVGHLLTGSCLRCGACTYFCAAGKNTMGIIAREEEKHGQ